MARGEGEGDPGHAVLLGQADGGLLAGLGMIEEPVKLVHAIPVPTGVGGILETLGLDLFGEFLELGEARVSGGASRSSTFPMGKRSRLMRVSSSTQGRRNQSSTPTTPAAMLSVKKKKARKVAPRMPSAPTLRRIRSPEVRRAKERTSTPATMRRLVIKSPSRYLLPNRGERRK
jgi:hypothetical protein